MIDLSIVKEIDVDYEFKRYNEEYSYSEIRGSRVISANNETMRITITNNDRTNDDETYQLIISNRDDGIFIKGDFFESPEEWYETSFTLTKTHALIVSEDPSEKMEIVLNF